MAREDAQMKLRLPEGLKDRVQQAADHGNQSMNALIVSVLELAFPQPSINLGELSAFLDGVQSEWEEGGAENSYIAEVNRGLAATKNPWTVGVVDGVVRFYPYATKPRDGSKVGIDPS